MADADRIPSVPIIHRTYRINDILVSIEPIVEKRRRHIQPILRLIPNILFRKVADAEPASGVPLNNRTILMY